MLPELFSVRLPVFGEITITSYGVMMALAFLVGYALIRRELARRGDDPELAADILLGALIGGIVGAKLHYVVLHWSYFEADPFGMLFSRAGLVWHGGFLGGALGVIWVIRRRGADLAVTADATAPALALAYALGRIGCFLVGDDYGVPTDSAVGVAFPRGAPPTTAGNLRTQYGVEVDPAVPDHEVLAVHPTQLYEAGMSILIFLLLMRLRRNPHRDGWLFGLWMVLAGLERFAVEFFRAKDDVLFGPITSSQLISLALLLGGVWILRARTVRPAERAGEAKARA